VFCDSEQRGGGDDWDHADLEALYRHEGRNANDEGEPINHASGGEEHVQAEPYGKV
jgi:hypothetical protein